ncbi:hypothetical protein EIP91_005074 [Steccherinum ochraceum]|uniref:Uncharacterized protein n=1 Tax=Steccherinum ochraceum TaxID=92696 RepID=A0A4R0RSA5_9APHY|nr:hypothetical protein EIP91_005074 [Steccherinum ochraceum]
MADIETLDRAEHTSTSEGVNGVQDQLNGQGSTAKCEDAGQAALIKSEQLSSEPSSASPSPGAGNVPLRGSTPNGTTPGPSTVPTLSVPHPKKFAHSNINKKFLEKTSSSTTTGSTLSSITSIKTSGSKKPVIQTAASHSRLVTAKLTAGPQPSTLTGPGWSRPSSTGSTVAPTPPSSTNPKPSPLSTPATTHAAPVSASAGKVIHPVPRNTTESLFNGKKDAGSKLVWGNTRPTGSGMDSVQNDFPTAAEVAQGRSAKLNEKKQAAQAAAAQKQAMAAEADAFRGVHLGSGHHWDEDEGDDDNFLEGVIEFGDGRQYTIPTEPRQASPPREIPELATDVEGDSSTKHSETPLSADHPVSKEERFQDDFDRSWPRSRGAPPPSATREQHPHRPPSSASAHSPQEGPRVLFNERSNRLEPYSSQAHRFPPREPLPTRRDSRSEHGSSPTESRRDLPPHSGRGVQLLQKPQDISPIDTSHRSRVFGDRPGFGHPNDRPRDKDWSRRDPAPHSQRQPQSAVDGRPRDHFNPLGLPHLSPVGTRGNDRTRRLSTGPDPLPPPPVEGGKDGRALPPHLTSLQVPPPQRGPPSAAPSESATGGPSSAHPTSQSPAASFASLSPRIMDSPLQSSTLPLVDIDEVRKAAMHSAAERARLRRQQEEEERERERERARRKAAELEAKMKETQGDASSETVAKENTEAEQKATVSEEQVMEILESAVRTASQGAPANALTSVAEDATSASSLPKAPFVRAPSIRGGVRPTPRRSSFPAPPVVSDASLPAAAEDSWRSKAGPLKPLHRPPPSVTSPVVPPVLPPPPTFPGVESFTLKADEEVEIVDFSELGKLVGKGPEPAQPPAVTPQPLTRPFRPVAADYFQEPGSSEPSTAPEESSWRRKLPPAIDIVPKDPEHVIAVSPDKPDFQAHPGPHSHDPLQRRMSTASDDHQRPQGTNPRSPLTPSYREAPMAALDDTMARIRGAMNGFQQKAEPPVTKQLPRWLPPALRPRSAPLHDDAPEEVFDVTGIEPPRSPKPAWHHYKTKLPSVSRAMDPVPKKRLHMASTVPHVRSDIYTWDPPIEGMNRRDFHFNDILFLRPSPPKAGRPKYHVNLPRNRVFRTDRAGKPVVNLPNRPVSATNGAFGKKREADDASSWRKPATVQKATSAENGEPPLGLDTTSRSPPPEAPSSAVVPPQTSSEDATSPTVSVAPAKSRTQPKMPQGSDVGFYRDSRSDSVPAPGSSVKFIVSSELEEGSSTQANGISLHPDPRTHGDMSPPPTSRVVTTESTVVVAQVTPSISAMEFKPEVRKYEPSNDVSSSVPMSPWSSKSSPRVFSVKDSPSRPPDRDHLKAVWETTSNKADGSVNSLERIGDDMPAVPFNILEVKSEDGETPPTTTSNPPSRMSQHDVTRAFQQVPASALHTSVPPRAPVPHAAHGPIPSVTSPPSRPPNHSMPPPQHPGAVRPMYPGYPSPLVSSPSPTVVYPMSMTPSPIPRPMAVNGTPQYPPQPMWVPMPGPPTSAPNGMMRHAPPYGAQLMPYPPPGGMYPPPPPHHGMQGTVPQPPNGMAGRPPPNGMPLISPVMAQAHAHPHPHSGPHPVYAQSPVLMHSPAAGHHPVGRPPYPNSNQPSGPPPRGGQMRGGAYPHPPAPGMMPYSPAGPHPPHQAPPYSAVPSNAYERPW